MGYLRMVIEMYLLANEALGRLVKIVDGAL
jgi:hypothetical protein